MRFRLRTLLIVLAVGPPLLAGLIVWCVSAGSTEGIAIRAFGTIVGIAVGALGAWLHWMAETEVTRRFRGRQNLSDAELNSAFSHHSGGRADDLTIEALSHVGQAFHVDYGKLRPGDRLADLLQPSWLAEHFRSEALEESLSSRFVFDCQEPIPTTLADLLARLRERSK